MAENKYTRSEKYPDIVILTVTNSNGETLRLFFDKEDYPRIASKRWQYDKTTVKTDHIGAIHFFIFNTFNSESFVHFKNGNKLDLRRSNMVCVKRNTYFFHGDESILEIRSNISMLNDPAIVRFSTDKFELIKKHNWRVSNHNYAIAHRSRKDGGGSIMMHQLICHNCQILPEGMVTDHINRDRLDNRTFNLRIITLSENSRNSRHKSTKHEFAGVTFVGDGSGRWMAKWPNPDKPGQYTSKSFYLCDYSADEAYKLAVAERLKWEKILGGFPEREGIV